MNAPNEASAAQPGFPERSLIVRPYNTRMAKRMVKRAKLSEEGVAVAFTFNNLSTMLVFGVVEDLAKVHPVFRGAH